MASIDHRTTVRRISRVVLAAGIAASVLWVATSTGCAGKRRAMRQREAELAKAKAADEALDLSTLAQSSKSAREVLDSQDASTWSASIATKDKSGARNSAGASTIYNEEPVILEDPSVGPDLTSNGGSRRVPKSARGSAISGASPVNVSPIENGASGTRELGSGETVVNAPVQITPGHSVAPIDVSVGLESQAASFSSAHNRSVLANELARAIVSELAPTTAGNLPRSSYRAGVGLIALDMIEAGSVNTELSEYTQSLAPHEHAAFESLRQLFASLARSGDASGNSASAWDPGQISQVLEAHQASRSGTEPVMIRSAALCTSVDGFGRYTPYASTTFVRGKSTPAIVYLALDHVAQKQASSGESGNWSIDLVQSAKIYHDSDNLVVVDLGEQVIRDSARDRRRDFCVARRIDLPASLSLGRYNLKVVLRDIGSGSTAEATIPIQIVADPSLTSK